MKRKVATLDSFLIKRVKGSEKQQDKDKDKDKGKSVKKVIGSPVTWGKREYKKEKRLRQQKSEVSGEPMSMKGFVPKPPERGMVSLQSDAHHRLYFPIQEMATAARYRKEHKEQAVTFRKDNNDKGGDIEPVAVMNKDQAFTPFIP